MPQKEVLMTYEGLKKLEEELEYLKKQLLGENMGIGVNLWNRWVK